MSSLPKARFTPEQYLEMERKAERKSEYWNGEIVAMAGGSKQHSLISVNVSGELRARLKDKPCLTYSSDLRVQVSPTRYFYPDISVVCGEPEFTGEEGDVLTNPTVLVEVLSPSTEDKDRGIKFAFYRQMETLTDYVMVSQEEARVEHYARQDNNHWLLADLRGMDTVLHLPSIGCELPLSEVYARVAFPPAAELEERKLEERK